jgi:tRNA pseudouridine55 synthase
MSADLTGVFLLDKPQGISSFEVLRKLRRTFQQRKMGYLGTLDPLATGVLVVFLGRATSLIPAYQELTKSYRAEAIFGKSSDSYDITGEVLEHDAILPTQKHIEDVLHQFLGSIWQGQPAFSALKFQGKRAYEHAREGKKINLGKRQVDIHQIDIISYEAPVLTFDMSCSSGTYVRSLIHELGEVLNCGAVMSALSRTAVGDISLENVVSLESCSEKDLLSPRQFLEKHQAARSMSEKEKEYLLRKFES